MSGEVLRHALAQIQADAEECLPVETVWVSVGSHRARAKLLAVTGPLASYGVWPTDKAGKTTGWPRGEFYKVSPELAERLAAVKGLRVMARAPRGAIFERGGW